VCVCVCVFVAEHKSRWHRDFVQSKIRHILVNFMLIGYANRRQTALEDDAFRSFSVEITLVDGNQLRTQSPEAAFIQAMTSSLLAGRVRRRLSPPADRSELFKTFNVAHISPHENTVNLPEDSVAYCPWKCNLRFFKEHPILYNIFLYRARLKANKLPMNLRRRFTVPTSALWRFVSGIMPETLDVFTL